MSSLRISNSFSFKKHEKSLRGSFLRARRGTVCRAKSNGHSKCRTTQKCAPRPPHASHPPSRAGAPSRVDRLSFFCVNGGSTSRLLCAKTKPAAPTQIDEHEHDNPHVRIESHAVITEDTDLIDSRARGLGWVAWFALALRERARLSGKCQKAP